MDIDTMVENHFKKNRDIFGFESIVELIEETMAELKDETISRLHEQDSSSPAAGRRSKERVIRLPVAFPTEISVGQEPSSQDREAFEVWMSRIPGNDLPTKVAAIQQFIENPPETSVAETLSFLMFLNTFAYVLKEFNASVAGFMWEPFLAGLIGGEASVQVPTSAHDIADVKLEGERFSLKILREDGAVGGSFTDLVKHFQANPDEPMTYYVIKKHGDKMKFYEFSISQDTLFEFVGHPSAEVGWDPVTIKVQIPDDAEVSSRSGFIKKPEFAKAIKGSPEYQKLPKVGNSSAKLHPDYEGGFAFKPGEVIEVPLVSPKQVAGQAGKGAKLTANAKHLWGEQEDYEKFYAARGKPGFWEAVEKSAPGFRDNRQFELGWNYAKVNKHVKNLGVIDISKGALDKAFARGAGAIGTDLTDMFNAITDLVDHVGKFFLLDCDGGKCTPEDVAERGTAGKEAVEDTNTLKRVVDAKIAPQITSARQMSLPGMGQEE